MPVVVALGCISVAAGGCGDSGSTEQAALEQARRQGAVTAHRAEAIHRLQKQVSSLQHERSEPASSAGTGGVATELHAGPSDDSRIPATGTYVGEAEQRGAPAHVNKNYPLEMTFSSSGSSVSYPSLDCEGSLLPLGFEASDRIYEEEITAGHCDNGGIWRVRVEGPTVLHASWSFPSASYGVVVTLQR